MGPCAFTPACYLIGPPVAAAATIAATWACSLRQHSRSLVRCCRLPQAREEGKSSPAKSVDASAFHLNAHAGTTAEQETAAGQVVASHSQAGQRPSR